MLSIELNGKEVVLIRHARVDLDYTGWMGHNKAAMLRAAYDTSAIYSFSADSVLNQLPDRICDTIYTSLLPRSIKTASSLFGDSVAYVASPLFNEYDLKVLHIPLYLTFKGWIGVSRACWLIGLNRKRDNDGDVEKRQTKMAVDYIEYKSRFDEQVILVSHGFINSAICRKLKKRGWHVKHHDGWKNLGATVLSK